MSIIQKEKDTQVIKCMFSKAFDSFREITNDVPEREDELVKLMAALSIHPKKEEKEETGKKGEKEEKKE